MMDMKAVAHGLGVLLALTGTTFRSATAQRRNLRHTSTKGVGDGNETR